jgi:phytoene dehydrogenase-like protein
MSTPVADHDVVVIGAGHNGLVAANYLADAGHDVLVVEANDYAGGMTSSGCTIPEAPHHVVNHCALDPYFWDAYPPARELGLHRYGLRMIRVDPAYAYLHPDGASIAFWQNPMRTAEEIRRFSPADADAFLEFARFLDALIDIGLPLTLTNPTRPDVKAATRVARGAFRHRRHLLELGAFGVSSANAVVGERFNHPVVRSAMYALCGSWAQPKSFDGTSLSFILLGFIHRFPAHRPLGGMQSIPDALVARLRVAGGSVLTSAPVAAILIRDDRARGVRLTNGTEIEARYAVLASCDPRTTLERLLPAGTLSATMESRVRNIPVDSNGYGQMKVDIAFSGRLDLSRHNRERRDGLDLRGPSHMIGTEEGQERAFARCGAGLLPDEDDYSMWNAILTGLDPSQGPEGQDSLYIWAIVPYAPLDGWKNVKDEAAQAIVNRAAQFYAGAAELELGRQVRTNEDIAELKNATGGCVLHCDFSLSRFGPLRPALGLGGYRTPIEGLYLGGAGSHPGGGVTGMPGYLSAREILRTMRPRAARTLVGSVIRKG